MNALKAGRRTVMCRAPGLRVRSQDAELLEFPLGLLREEKPPASMELFDEVVQGHMKLA